MLKKRVNAQHKTYKELQLMTKLGALGMFLSFLEKFYLVQSLQGLDCWIRRLPCWFSGKYNSKMEDNGSSSPINALENPRLQAHACVNIKRPTQPTWKPRETKLHQ